MSNFKIRVVLQGHVKFREGRKWKRRYCLLSLAPTTTDAMHLYITKSYDEFTVYRNQGCMIDACQLLPHTDGGTGCRPDLCYSQMCHNAGRSSSGGSVPVNSAAAATQATSAGLSAAHSLASSLSSGAPAPIDEVTGFESGLHLDKESHVVILIGTNAVHAVSLSSLAEVFTWAKTIKKVVTDDHFRVTLSQTADGSKLPLGLQASLHVQHWRVCLIGEPTAGCKFLCAWPLNTIDQAHMLTVSAPSASSMAGGGGAQLTTSGAAGGETSYLRSRASRTNVLSSSGRTSSIVSATASTLSGLGSVGAGSGGAAATANTKNVFQLEANADARKGRGLHTFDLAANCHLPDLTAAIERLMALRHPHSSVATTKSGPLCANSGNGTLSSSPSGQQHCHHCHGMGAARSLQPPPHPHLHQHQHWAAIESAGGLKNVTSCHGLAGGGCAMAASAAACSIGGSSCSPVSSSSPSEGTNSCSTGSLGAPPYAIGSQPVNHLTGGCSCHLLSAGQRKASARSSEPSLRQQQQTTTTAAASKVGFLSEGDRSLATAAAASSPASRKSMIACSDRVGELGKDKPPAAAIAFCNGSQQLLLVDERHRYLSPCPPQRRPVVPSFDQLLLNDPSTGQRSFKVNIIDASVVDGCHRAFSLTEVALKQQEQSHLRLQANALAANNSGSSTAASPTSPAPSSYPLDDLEFKPVDPSSTTAAGALLPTTSYDRELVGSTPPLRGISEYANFSALLLASKTSNYSGQDHQRSWWKLGASISYQRRQPTQSSSLDLAQPPPPLSGGGTAWSRAQPPSSVMAVDRLPPTSPFCKRQPAGEVQVERRSPSSAIQLANVDGVGTSSGAGHRLALTAPTTTTTRVAALTSSGRPNGNSRDAPQDASAVVDHRPGFGVLLQPASACPIASRVAATGDVNSVVGSRRQSQSCDDLRLQRSDSGGDNRLVAFPLSSSHQLVPAVPACCHSGAWCGLPLAIRIPSGESVGHHHRLPSGPLPKVPSLGCLCGTGEADPTDSRGLLLLSLAERHQLTMAVGPRLLLHMRSTDELLLSETACWLVLPGHGGAAQNEAIPQGNEMIPGRPQLLVNLRGQKLSKLYSRNKGGVLQEEQTLLTTPVAYKEEEQDADHSLAAGNADMTSGRLLSSAEGAALSLSESCLLPPPCHRSVRSGVGNRRSPLSVIPSQDSRWCLREEAPVPADSRQPARFRTTELGWDLWLRTLLARLTTDDDGKRSEVIPVGVSGMGRVGPERHSGKTVDSTATCPIARTTEEATSPSIPRTALSDGVGEGTEQVGHLPWHQSISCRSEVPPALGGAETQGAAALPPAYCNVASLLQHSASATSSTRSSNPQTRGSLPSSWGAPAAPQQLAKKCPTTTAAYVNVASLASSLGDSPVVSSRSSLPVEPRRRQNWFHTATTCRRPHPQHLLHQSTATLARSSVEAGWTHACPHHHQQQEICCDLHSNDAARWCPLTCATAGAEAMQFADPSMLRSHQMLHAPHILSVGDLPEEVRDPSRNYAVVDLRPSPASSTNPAFSQRRSHYPKHRTNTNSTGLDDIRWSDSSAAVAIFGSNKTTTNNNSTGSDCTGSDGATLTCDLTVSTDAFPHPASSSTTVVRPSSLSVRQSAVGAPPHHRRRHSHSLSLTVDCGFPTGLESDGHTRTGSGAAGGATMTLDRSLVHHHHLQQQHQAAVPSQPQQLNYVHVFASTCSNRTQSSVDPLNRLLASVRDATLAIATTSNGTVATSSVAAVATSFGSSGCTGSSGNDGGSRSMTSSATSSSGEGGAGGGIAMGAGSATADTGFTSSCSPPPPPPPVVVDDGHVAYTQIDFARTLALGELSGDMDQHPLAGSSKPVSCATAPLLSRWSVAGRMTSSGLSSNHSTAAVATGGNTKSVRKTLSRSIRSIRRSTAASHRKKSGGLLG